MTPPPARVPPGLTIQLFVSGLVINPMNRLRGHWSHRARWASEWRHKTRLEWLNAGRPQWVPGEPAHVVITAYVAKPMDLGAIGPSVKPVEDEALFLMLRGIERPTRDGRMQRIAPDGPRDGHQIAHTQAVRPAYRGVLVTITPAEAAR